MLTPERPLLLGSGSPRRKALLETVGVPLVVRPPDVDEAMLPGEDPSSYVTRICELKRRATLSDPARPPECHAILVADTTVTVDGRILGKPRDDEEAFAMITALAGRSHFVISGYLLCRLDDPCEVHRVVTTEVSMRAVEVSELREYVSTGEGRDKAGAYAIQGRGAALISRISGSYTNVVGLPLSEVVTDLRRMGLWGASA